MDAEVQIRALVAVGREAIAKVERPQRAVDPEEHGSRFEEAGGRAGRNQWITDAPGFTAIPRRRCLRIADARASL
jgi:hypothetical protein